MAEVTAPQAAEITGITYITLYRRVEDGTLPSRRIGIRGEIRVNVDDLRAFAERLGYRFNEALATQFAK